MRADRSIGNDQPPRAVDLRAVGVREEHPLHVAQLLSAEGLQLHALQGPLEARLGEQEQAALEAAGQHGAALAAVVLGELREEAPGDDNAELGVEGME